MEDFVVAKRGDYLLAKIFCKECGNEIERTGKRGRPAKVCAACKADRNKGKAVRNTEIAAKLLRSAGVAFRVNVSDEGEEPNFVSVQGEEFWRAMATKALMRRAARDGGEIPATDPQEGI